MQDIIIVSVIALCITGLFCFVLKKWVEVSIEKAVLEEKKEQREYEAELKRKIDKRLGDGINDGADSLRVRLRKGKNQS